LELVISVFLFYSKTWTIYFFLMCSIFTEHTRKDQLLASNQTVIVQYQHSVLLLWCPMFEICFLILNDCKREMVVSLVTDYVQKWPTTATDTCQIPELKKKETNDAKPSPREVGSKIVILYESWKYEDLICYTDRENLKKILEHVLSRLETSKSVSDTHLLSINSLWNNKSNSVPTVCL
jgi:hypothetical protein